MTKNISRCPICGRKPKIEKRIYVIGGKKVYGFVFYCKPFFRKPHIYVGETGTNKYLAKIKAKAKWNNYCERAKNEI